MVAKLLLLALIFLLVIVQGCEQKKETFEYLRFPDKQGKQRIITKMILEERVYFIYYIYNKKEIPPAYISPLSGMDNYYLCHLYWEVNKAFLLTNMGEWQIIGNPKNFYFLNIEDNVEYIEKTSIMKADKSGKYQYSSGDIF